MCPRGTADLTSKWIASPRSSARPVNQTKGATVFAVIFEVYPKPDKWDDYLALAKILRPELEKIDGFVDNIRYRSLTREDSQANG
jgi:hypothetical protein